MKKLLLVFIVIPCLLQAQETDTLAVDTLVVTPPLHALAVFLNGGVRLSPNPSGLKPMGTVGLGIRYKRFGASALYTEFLGDYEVRLIFPNFFELSYQHAGFGFSYYLYENSSFSIEPFLSWQFGDITWKRSKGVEALFKEEFSVIQVGARLDFRILKQLRPGVVLGYQSFSEIRIPGLERGDFTGIFVGFNVKVGYFNQ